MSTKAAGPAWRVGSFTVAGLALLVLGLLWVGGRWWEPVERAEMRFQSSVWGLQVGAPVVLRGVRVGRVTAVSLAPSAPRQVVIPVQAEFDSKLLSGLLGESGAHTGPALPTLVSQGLVARLATQSLLTGLLYVDLDVDPARAHPGAATNPATTTIPTEPTRLQTLQAQLEGVDLGQLGRDLTQAVAAMRRLLAEPGAEGALARTAQAAGAVERAARRIERDTPVLVRSATETLDHTRTAVSDVVPAMQQAADQVARAAAELQGLASAGHPVAADLRRAAQELARAAVRVGDVAADGSPLRAQTEQTLQDISRAARSMAELAELLQQHPESIWRGRPDRP